MILIHTVQNIMDAGTDQFIKWVTQILPQTFLFLIFLNAVTQLIGRGRVERLAARCGSNAFLRYLVLPFFSAVVLGNPMALSMGRYLPERYKPAYFASASYHCHTNSGIFGHINPAELFLWLGIANGVLSRGQTLFPLAIRYLCAGLAANFVSGYAAELITIYLAGKQQISLEATVDLDVSENREDLESPSKAKARAAASSPYRSIIITHGEGGYGGPVIVTPTPERHTVLYMIGGGILPEPLEKIISLSGMEAVDGNLESCPDEQVALAIIDCGGTLRCGIYPGKGIPTANLLATGKSGPLSKYMTEDIYVSAVTSEQVSPAFPKQDLEKVEKKCEEDHARCNDHDPAWQNDQPRPGHIVRATSSASRIISIFHQSARDTVRTCIETLLPFMGFAALFIGICKGSGLTGLLAGLIQPVEVSIPGLIGFGILCSVPGLSAILSAGAVAAQMFSTLFGEMVASGGIPVYMALPALFAINCQCACDFIPVGLGMSEARPQTTQIGIAAVTFSRFATGWIRILIALLFSIGL